MSEFDCKMAKKAVCASGKAILETGGAATIATAVAAGAVTVAGGVATAISAAPILAIGGALWGVSKYLDHLNK